MWRAALLLAVVGLAAAPGALAGDHEPLLQLTPAGACADAARVTAAGGELVSATLRLYRVPAAAAPALARELRARGTLQNLQPDREWRPAARADVFADPFVPEQWWRAALGIADLTPPGPGRPITIVDSGADLSHPEFAGRPDTIPLNAQTVSGSSTGSHGTAVASLAGAAANGTGMVGIYPQAALRVWDVSPFRTLLSSEVATGIVAAADAGQGVINLSLAGTVRDAVIEQAVYHAISRGSIVVAAVGNERQEGNATQYPAGLPHVVTVGATGRDGNVTAFSNTSPTLDLVAPGDDMLVATPGGGYARGATGTSFAAPLVAGAAAWLWTARPELDAGQVVDVLRRTAVDVGAPGFDEESGYGRLNLPAALTAPPPLRDVLEPNDDVEFVKPLGFFSTTRPPLTTAARPVYSFAAHVDAVDDPRDVYRFWIPGRRTLTVTATTQADVDVSVWASDTVSVLQAPRRDRLARSARPGPVAERVVVRNEAPRGFFGYLAIQPGAGTVRADYVARITTAPLPKPKPKPKPRARR